MARPQRLNVEYFPHYIARGRKMSFLEKKFGNDGYATWFKILEELGEANHHFLDLRQETQVMFLSDRCGVEEEVLFEIIDFLVKVEEFDSELWTHKVLWSQKFNDSVFDAWKRRNNLLMTKNDLIAHLGLSKVSKSKKKHSTPTKQKTNDKKEKTEVIMPWDSDAFIKAWEVWKSFKKETFRQNYKPIGEQMALKKLAKLSGGIEETAILIIQQSMENGWKGLFELKQENNVKSNQNRSGEKQSTVSPDYIQGVLDDLQSGE